MNTSLKKIVLSLPRTPGVYLFYDSIGKIIYIGKATSLQIRVSSYFRGTEAVRPIETMIHRVANIKIQKTESVLEALILEANLIKKYQPKYNVDLKDDKSFSYFVITNQKFPRVIILRETELADKKEIIKSSFGPYTSKKNMEVALDIVRRIFPFHSLKQETEKGCLDFQIGKCPGPYADAISQKNYLKNIQGIKMILEGKKRGLILKLESEMKKYSRQNEFEKAAEVRNKIFALKHIRDVALISEEKAPNAKYRIPEIRVEAYDVSNLSGKQAVGSMVVFKGDEEDKSQYRKFRIKRVNQADDVGMMREILLRRLNNDWPKPELILLDGGEGHLNMGVEVLKGLNLDISIGAVAKGPKRKNLQLSAYNLPKSGEVPSLLKDRKWIKRIMDEAHRFAIVYHKKLRRKNLLK